MLSVNSKTFKSGNSVAVRLPKGFAIEPDTPIIIEQTGDSVTIRLRTDPEHERRELERLLDDLAAIGAAPDGVQDRDPFEWPDRPGL